GLLWSPEAFDGRYRSAGGAADRRRARADGAAVDEHRAGAALTETAAELEPVLRELVAQHVEERLRGVPGVGGHRPAIQPESIRGHEPDSIARGGRRSGPGRVSLGEMLRRFLQALRDIAEGLMTPQPCT